MECATGLETQVSTNFNYLMTTSDVGWRGPSVGPRSDRAEGPLEKGFVPIDVLGLVHDLSRAIDLLRELKTLIDFVRSALPQKTDGQNASPSPAQSPTTDTQQHLGSATVADTRHAARACYSGAGQQHMGRAIVADTVLVVSGHERLEIDPRAPDCSPLVRGTRVSVGEVVSLLTEGRTGEQVQAIHPELTQEDIQACLNYIGAEDVLGPDLRAWPS